MVLSVQQINKWWLNKLWYSHYIKILCNLKKGVSLTYYIDWSPNIEKRRKKNIYPTEFRLPKNSEERWKAFLSEQCKEIEENNRMGKTRNLFKKIRETKRTFLAKMGTIKDRKWQGPT